MERVIEWITAEQVNEIEKNKTVFFGDEIHFKYREIEDFSENVKDALIKELIEKKYIICGDTHQYYYLPVFEGNRYLELSMGKWGEIMTEVWKLRGFNTRPNFYLAALCNVEEQLPYELPR